MDVPCIGTLHASPQRTLSYKQLSCLQLLSASPLSSKLQYQLLFSMECISTQEYFSVFSYYTFSSHSVTLTPVQPLHNTKNIKLTSTWVNAHKNADTLLTFSMYSSSIYSKKQNTALNAIFTQIQEPDTVQYVTAASQTSTTTVFLSVNAQVPKIWVDFNYFFFQYLLPYSTVYFQLYSCWIK